MNGYGMTDAEAFELAIGLPGGQFENPPVWREAVAYEAKPEGHRAVVMVRRCPAQFWRVTCPDLGLDLATGSGMGAMATAMAEAIADGFLGRYEPPAEAEPVRFPDVRVPLSTYRGSSELAAARFVISHMRSRAVSRDDIAEFRRAAIGCISKDEFIELCKKWVTVE